MKCQINGTLLLIMKNASNAVLVWKCVLTKYMKQKPQNLMSSILKAASLGAEAVGPTAQPRPLSMWEIQEKTLHHSAAAVAVVVAMVDQKPDVVND